MKRTEIKYQQTADKKIRILAIENVARRQELEKIDPESARIYLADGVYYEGVATNQLYVHPSQAYYQPGMLLGKQDFADLIGALISAGNRWQEIRRQVAACATVTSTITI